MVMQLLNNQPPTLVQSPPTPADQERKQRMQEAWRAYRGDFPKPLKVKANQPDDNVLTNRCGPIVDKGVSFLFGQILKIEAVDETTQDSSQIQDFLNGLWGDDDNRMTFLAQLAINGGVCGQTFVKILPASGTMKYPRLVILDPMLVRVVTAADDCSLPLAYIIEYPATADFQKRQVISCIDPHTRMGCDDWQVAGAWSITNYLKKNQTGAWLQTGDSDTWAYPFPPIFSCQNLPNPNELWGIPDLTSDLINQNKVINFIQSNTARILKYHAHPKTYATGIGLNQINTGVDELLVLSSPDAKLSNLEMTSDLQSSLSFFSSLLMTMDELSRVPAVALGRLADMPRGNVSGVALQLLFQPLLEKTTQKQRLYGSMIRMISRAALVIGGLIKPEEFEDYPIELHWQNLLPVDNLAAAQTAVILQQLGVSNTTLLQQLGYSPDDEEEKSNAEDARKNVAYTRGQGQPEPVGLPDQQTADVTQASGDVLNA